ncbi:tripartite tricarboxylate transporter TctB family protein [Bacillus sp. JJ1521]|uniref:tripartite tricarboxylate transporter TctB family protein n=1 Tax=Bacillus sp. JJ1521 TaxID=3122957 RepID=UPI002FFF7D9C
MRNAGVLAAILIIIFSSFFLYHSTTLDYTGPLGLGPGFFPLWLSILLLFLSIIYLMMSFKEVIDIREILPKGKSLLDFTFILLSMILFILLIERTGFVIAGTVSLIVLLFRTFKWYFTLSLSVGISLAIFIIFAKGLSIPFPVNSFGW